MRHFTQRGAPLAVAFTPRSPTMSGCELTRQQSRMTAAHPEPT